MAIALNSSPIKSYAALWLLPCVLVFLNFGCDRAATDRHSDTEATGPAAGREAIMADAEVTQESAVTKFSPPPVAGSGNYADPGRPQNRMLIRTAQIRCRVENYQQVAGQMPQLVKRYQGYISHESEVKNEHTLEDNFVLRVPDSQFDALVAQLVSMASYIDYKNISSEDVGEEFVDLEARMRARKAAEERYLQLLAQANRVQDMVAVENQLRQIREEIEVVQGRMQYLRNQVSLSTINFTIYQPVAYQREPGKGFVALIGESLQKGWQMVLDLLVFLVRLWPVWLALALLFALIRWRRAERKAKPGQPQP